jgi:tartrate dehydrogenase/decarboxylase/D-malate dehydrogenase
MGKDLANPVATFWSAAEMLRWLGEEKAADALMAAISVTLGKGETTGDLGGRMKTSEVVEATCRAIEKAA